MGLDMYLSGHVYQGYKSEMKLEGHPVRSLELELGCWRKHPNLHGYIVNEFADGKDECQKIELDHIALRKIALAIERDELPHTDGFFFGDSEFHDKARCTNVNIFREAADWIEPKDWKYSVYYQASW